MTGVKRTVMTSVLCGLLGVLPLGARGEDGEILLRDLAAGQEKYQGQKITMTLKFKHLDTLFGKIYFYDRKNFDIVFDMTLQATMREYRTEILNLHEGLDYRVTFLFNGVGNIGLITGELIGFTPVILSSLPDGDKKSGGINK